MHTLIPKRYQADALENVGKYFDKCHEMGDASFAFQAVTEELWGRRSQFNSLAGFDARMPYFCLRVPTGGGKTFMAAKAVSIVNSRLLRMEHGLILWLTPSKAIREQTLRALRDREHPYHAALLEAGPVTVLELDEAKTITPSTLDTSTVVIVCTRQAFQVDNEENRKVYEESGDLMSHFGNLTPEQKAVLDCEAGRPAYSFMNVMRLRRPFVIVDEAHNNRTELGFDTLAKFHPSGIMELTATPDMVKNPSNVLHSVYAGELKQDEMIKLPIMLETEPDWQRCLGLAIDLRGQLSKLARNEQLGSGAPYLRPIVLIQAEKRSAGTETRDYNAVKRELIENQNVPENEILIATGDEKGLEQISKDFEGGILSERCPINYVITQQALAEGWDCPFAYILVSLMELRSATRVEQLLGRILRQPNAKRRASPDLNRSYAFVVSRNFSDTANTLRDQLVSGAGFERMEASEFVAARKPVQTGLDYGRYGSRVQVQPVAIALPESIDIRSLPKETKSKVTWDEKNRTLTVNKPLTGDEVVAVQALAVMEESKAQIQKGADKSLESINLQMFPAERNVRFAVPQLNVLVNGELHLFNEPEALEYTWDLPMAEAAPTTEQLQELGMRLMSGETAEIDIDEKMGKVRVGFLNALQRELVMSYIPEHWDEAKLGAWLCRNVQEPSLSHQSKLGFIARWLGELLKKEGFDLAFANREKFLIRDITSRHFTALRAYAAQQAYQTFMFGEGFKERVKVGGGNYEMYFDPDNYSPVRDYDERFGPAPMQGHFYARIGDFDSKEEYECACWLSSQAVAGRIEFWVRNLAKRPCSFYLQTGKDKFFPDFICKLSNGKILVVEYKGANLWVAAEEDRKIGNLWAELSGDRCRFVMVTDKNWAGIDAKMK